MNNKRKYKIVLNSPAILTFSFLCVAALIINMVTGGAANRSVFSVYRSSLTQPLTYVRFFGHVLGHSSVSHLVNNLMMILLLGPGLEDRYGSRRIVILILVTALLTGLIYFIFFPHAALLGASGVVFAFIVLSAAIGIREREIPLTFLLVIILYLGEQLYSGLFTRDNISQLTHIAGGVTGGFFAYSWRGRK